MFKVGDLVELVGTDGYMPPLGSYGEVRSPEDWRGDHDVYFPVYPCPVPPDTTWSAHKSWLRLVPPAPVAAIRSEAAKLKG